MRRSGFTILEILVCIAIIATLAALLYPSMGVATLNARRSSAVENICQHYIAMKLYQEEAGGERQGATLAQMNYPHSLEDKRRILELKGFPHQATDMWAMLRLTADPRLSPCGNTSRGFIPTIQDVDILEATRFNLPFYFEKYGDNMILSHDSNCNNFGTYSSICSVDFEGKPVAVCIGEVNKTSIGVLHNGKILKKSSNLLHPDQPEFWVPNWRTTQ